MRLMLLVPSLQAGGAERVLSSMANYWAQQNYDITIVTLASERQAPFYALHHAIQYRALNQTMPSFSVVQAIKRNIIRVLLIRSIIKETNADVLISFIDHMNILVLASALGLKVPVIVSERNNPLYRNVGRFKQLLRRCLYPTAGRVVVQTSDIADVFPVRLRARMRIIANPVSPLIVAKPVGMPADREHYRLVAFGRLVEQKGFDLLLPAFAAIAQQHPQWSLTIWGEGEQRPALEALVQRLGLGGRVCMPGVTTEPFAEMARADVFVLSSRYEGFPNVLCEAMACGLPVVSFDCPSGPRAMISDGIDGILVPPGDVGALAAALSRLMGDAAERARLAQRAPEIVKRFGFDQVMEQWNSVIAELLPAAQHVRASDLQREIVS